MRRLFLIFLNKIAFLYFHGWFVYKQISFPAIRTIVFIDIDNTIADTWPSLVDNAVSSKHRHKNLAVHEGMRSFIINNYLSMPDIQVIYLSARCISLFYTTLEWLREHQFTNQKSGLIMVSSPHEKLYYLKKVVKKNSNVIYIDDLSYNHENGSICFYSEVITQVRKLPILYIGVDQINAINEDFQNTKRDF